MPTTKLLTHKQAKAVVTLLCAGAYIGNIGFGSISVFQWSGGDITVEGGPDGRVESYASPAAFIRSYGPGHAS